MIKLKDILNEAVNSLLVKKMIKAVNKGEDVVVYDKKGKKYSLQSGDNKAVAVTDYLGSERTYQELPLSKVKKIVIEGNLTEASFTKKRDFGNQKYWTVTKSFTAQTYTGKYKGTGQHYGGFGRGTSELQKAITTKLDVKKGMELQALPGGLFIIDGRKKKAYGIQDKSFSINDKFVEPRTSKITDFSLWKRWSPYKDTR